MEKSFWFVAPIIEKRWKKLSRNTFSVTFFLFVSTDEIHQILSEPQQDSILFDNKFRVNPKSGYIKENFIFFRVEVNDL